ncbi:MAG: hypothetical protein V2B19_01580 [Pseudomonadota bacterium]
MNPEAPRSSGTSDYQKEQIAALQLVRTHLASLGGSETARLRELISPYQSFRAETDLFLSSHFSQICSGSCYENRLSACCSKEGIITFFADVVINALLSGEGTLNRLQERLSRPNTGFKCVYLAEDGCLWKMKPIVCQMFLCDKAEKKVFEENLAAGERWDALKQQRKEFTWPDRPVVFDRIETLFIEAGYVSPLMYLHNSPGLIRVKRRAGLLSP